MLVGPNEFTDFYKLLISNYKILSFTSWLYFFKLHLFVFEYVECMMCVCGGGESCHKVCGCQRTIMGQSDLSFHVSQRLSCGWQARQQTSLPTEPLTGPKG